MLCPATQNSFLHFLQHPFQNIQGCLSGDPYNIVTLATQTLPAIQAPHPHYANRLTPPYHDESKSNRPWMAGCPQRGPDDFFPVSHRSAQSTPQLSPTQSHSAMHPPLRNSPRQHAGHLTLSLPPLRQLSSTPPTPSSRRHDNPLGVQSILNPQAELIEQQRDRRRSGCKWKLHPRWTLSTHIVFHPSVGQRVWILRRKTIGLRGFSSHQADPLQGLH